MRKTLVLAGMAMLALAGCGKKAGPPTLFTWEDYRDAPFLAEYAKAFNETPGTVIFADEDEAFAKMQRGFKPDVMGPCYYEFPRWKEADLLQPIDTAKLKNWNKLSPTLRHLPGIDAGGTSMARLVLPHALGNAPICKRSRRQGSPRRRSTYARRANLPFVPACWQCAKPNIFSPGAHCRRIPTRRSRSYCLAGNGR